MGNNSGIHYLGLENVAGKGFRRPCVYVTLRRSAVPPARHLFGAEGFGPPRPRRPPLAPTRRRVAGGTVQFDFSKVDTGASAWVLASAAFVLLMTPGVAFFYGG